MRFGPEASNLKTFLTILSVLFCIIGLWTFIIKKKYVIVLLFLSCYIYYLFLLLDNMLPSLPWCLFLLLVAVDSFY